MASGTFGWGAYRARALVACAVSAACADAGRAPTEPAASVAPAAGAVFVDLDVALQSTLARHGFTGRSSEEPERRLGRPLDPVLVEAGRLLFFDPVLSLTGDNSCSGCHSPTASFGGTQSIAIGVQNNGIVGPDRAGPRNQRRSPTVANVAPFPRLMLNSRFESLSGDPFDNSAGFSLLAPEGSTLSYLPHLLAAQAFLPVVDRSEMAGFDVELTREEMRAELARRVDGAPRYRRLFGRVFPDVAAGEPVSFDHIGLALSEFQVSLVFLDAPIDAFARGRRNAMSDAEKRGALLFFGEAGCVRCHAVDVPFAAGREMFTDYRHHVIGVPQIAPAGTNVEFDGAGDEDFGREHVTRNAADRYAFRTSPLRNVALQPWFMHNGAFGDLETAVRHHLDARASARGYTPAALDPDLRGLGPIEPVLERLDSMIDDPPALTESEIDDLVAFVRCGLLDVEARPDRLRRFVPGRLPSGARPHDFQFRPGRDPTMDCPSMRGAGNEKREAR